MSDSPRTAQISGRPVVAGLVGAGIGFGAAVVIGAVVMLVGGLVTAVTSPTVVHEVCSESAVSSGEGLCVQHETHPKRGDTLAIKHMAGGEMIPRYTYAPYPFLSDDFTVEFAPDAVIVTDSEDGISVTYPAEYYALN